MRSCAVSKHQPILRAYYANYIKDCGREPFMQISRTINVLTLAALLLLTGCLGITPPAEGEEASNAIVNNPPTVFISEALNELSLENGTNPTYNSSSGEL